LTAQQFMLLDNTDNGMEITNCTNNK